MISKDYFFSVERQEWTRKQPATHGDMKYDRGFMYTYDGKQWRRQCRVCTKIARKTYCVDHGSHVNVSPETSPVSARSCNVKKTRVKARRKLQHSKKACQYLDQLSRAWDVRIIHKHFRVDHDNFQGVEFRVPGTPFRVDGLVNGSQTVVEVLGDYWHGNLDKYSASDTNTTTNSTFGALNIATFKRLEAIQEQGFEVYYAWESDIDKQTDDPLSVLRRLPHP